MMSFGNEECNPIKDIPHEIMYCFGLNHTFEEEHVPNQKFHFTQSKTTNYMDYYCLADSENPS